MPVNMRGPMFDRENESALEWQRLLLVGFHKRTCFKHASYDTNND